jgi:hypothetical protein
MKAQQATECKGLAQLLNQGTECTCAADRTHQCLLCFLNFLRLCLLLLPFLCFLLFLPLSLLRFLLFFLRRPLLLPLSLLLLPLLPLSLDHAGAAVLPSVRAAPCETSTPLRKAVLGLGRAPSAAASCSQAGFAGPLGMPSCRSAVPGCAGR